jgi:uncharacterized repeat protein (TIGR03803 family)
MKTWATILGIFLWSCGSIPAQTFQAIYNFSSSPYTFPNGRVLLLNGILFGTTSGGGATDSGTIFTINTNGSRYAALKSFTATDSNTGTNTDGVQPMDGLVSYSNILYGTTYGGGFGGKGTVFSYNTNSRQYTVLNHFNTTNGKAPYANLTLYSNAFYGTTAAGGISNKGAIFRINPDGSGFTLIKSFFSNEGILLLGRVVTDGRMLYGTTYQGGVSNRGTIYSIGTDGGNFTVLKTFNADEGAGPRYDLVLAGNRLYGVLESGSNSDNSAIYRLNTDGTGFSVLKQFSDVDQVSGTNADGWFVRGGLAWWNGALYGTASEGGWYGGGVVYKINPDGTGFAVLKHFTNISGTISGTQVNTGGMQPAGELTIQDGVIYGTTREAGMFGDGTLYRLTIPPVPGLQMTNITGQPILFWNDDGYSRVLQTASDLSTGNWGNVNDLNWTNASVSPNQIGLRITNILNVPTTFYRLQ